MKVIVTGGAGFIGSAVIRKILTTTSFDVINVDCLTYASNPANVSEVADNSRYKFAKLDIRDNADMRELFETERPDAIINLAAESHVDRSISDPNNFIGTNVFGTYNLLEIARAYVDSAGGPTGSDFRFVHVSTDEVFGSLGPQGTFDEETPYRPNSPYSASKAASDHLVRAWHHTYDLPTIITNCSNNYGPFQFPEKLIPLVIRKAIGGERLPVYGNGENVRDWLYVDDHAEALLLVLQNGVPGESYAIGGNAEKRNIDVVRSICAVLDELLPDAAHRPHESLIQFVEDRPGHDFRYAINAEKIRRELGWQPREDFASGLRKTVQWYVDKGDWYESTLKSGYRGERLGMVGRHRTSSPAPSNSNA